VMGGGEATFCREEVGACEELLRQNEGSVKLLLFVDKEGGDVLAFSIGEKKKRN